MMETQFQRTAIPRTRSCPIYEEISPVRRDDGAAIAMEANLSRRVATSLAKQADLLKSRPGLLSALAASASFLLGVAGVAYIFDTPEPSATNRGTTYFTAFINGSPDTRLLVEGWSQPEVTGTWTVGPRAEMRLPLTRPPASNVHIAVTGWIYPWHAMKKQAVRVVVNGFPVTTIKKATDSDDIYGTSFDVPLQVARAQSPMHLVYEVENPTAPSSLDGTSDTRLLGFKLGTMEVSYRPE